ncbi:MAG: sigma-70 family RNA polymerase sigma factor [Planctomycetota bacterium]
MESDSTTRASLLVELRDGADASAWQRFVLQYGPIIHRWCLYWKLQQADAEDVTQGMLLKLFHQLKEFRYDQTRGSFRGWLKTVTRNAVRDYMRKQRDAVINGDSDVWQQLQNSPAHEDFATRLAEAYDLERLDIARERVRQRVAPHTWQAFELGQTTQLSAKEIAAQTGLQVAMVYVAKGKVIRMLGEEVERLDAESSSEHG